MPQKQKRHASITISTNILKGKPYIGFPADVADETRARAGDFVGAGDGTAEGTSIVSVSLMNAVGADEGTTDGVTVTLFANTVGRELNVALSIVGTRLVLFVREGGSGSEGSGACDAVTVETVGESAVGIIMKGAAVFVIFIKDGIIDGGSRTVSVGDTTGTSVCCFSRGDSDGCEVKSSDSGCVG